MNQIVSFRRLGLLLRSEWIEKKQLIVREIVLYVCALVLFALFLPSQLQTIILAGTVVCLMNHSVSLNKATGSYLGKPASALEKYLVILLIATLLWLPAVFLLDGVMTNVILLFVCANVAFFTGSKTTRKWLGISFILLFASFFLDQIFGFISGNPQADIGMVGDAEGPTAVFVSRKLFVWGTTGWGLSVIFLLIGYLNIKYRQDK